MSRENVEVVRRFIDALNRADLEAASEYVDPGAEVDWSRSRGVEAGIYRGDEAVRKFWRTFFDVFDEFTVTPEEFIELGDHVVVPNRTRMSGRDGIEVYARSAVVHTVRHGRIVEWTLYQEKAEALEAAGPSE
ncbi:MAG: nuclear transport factor 2 family protein [Solirubrobacteraceae bacterium]